MFEIPSLDTIKQLIGNLVNQAKSVIGGASPTAGGAPVTPPTLPALPQVPAVTLPDISGVGLPNPTNIIPKLPESDTGPSLPELPSLPAIPTIPTPEELAAMANIPPLPPLPEVPPLPEIPLEVPPLPTIPPVANPTAGLTLPGADGKTGMDKIGLNPTAQIAIINKDDIINTTKNIKMIMEEALTTFQADWKSANSDMKTLITKFNDKANFPKTEEGWKELCDDLRNKFAVLKDVQKTARASSVDVLSVIDADPDTLLARVQIPGIGMDAYKLNPKYASLAEIHTSLKDKFAADVEYDQKLSEDTYTILSSLSGLTQEAGSVLGGPSYALWKLYDGDHSPEKVIGVWLRKLYMIEGAVWYTISDNGTVSNVTLEEYFDYADPLNSRLEQINKYLPA